MPMLHLQPQPRREPFSDWKAQVERLIALASPEPVTFANDCQYMRSCYDCGLTAREVALDFIEA